MKPVEPLALQGWDASLELGFDHDCGTTRLARRRHAGPLVVQRPLYAEGSSVCQAIVVHPPGGIAGGDRLEVLGMLGVKAHAQLTTPGATKWYRSLGREASQRVRLIVAGGAVCEWLPQENIVFDGARACLRLDVELATAAAYCGWELTCLGRPASGEPFASGTVSQCSRLSRAGRTLLRERAVIDGQDCLREAAPVLQGNCAYGTLIAIGPALTQETLARAREVVSPCTQAGVTAMGDMIVARWVGRRIEEGRALFTSLWAILRPWYAQRVAVVPRIWST
ncbi:MAG: urease accessory protein UreD [Burkholderiales bacterium]